MIDMHCHILPRIDDGPQNERESMELLIEEKRQGIQKIIFTPHFNPEIQSLEKFLQARKNSYENLKATEGFQEIELETKLGAEVFFSMRLIEMDISKLAFEDTGYILIEFPVTARPYGITYTMQNIIERGYTPILAHIERYNFFTSDPIKLYNLVTMGCIAQVNASSVINGINIKGVSAIKYINWELAHIICSDVHSMNRRPPNTKLAYEIVERKLGSQYTDWLIKNSYDIFNNKYFDTPIIHKPKKFLGCWR